MFSIRQIFSLAFLAFFSLPLIIALPLDTDTTSSGRALEPRSKLGKAAAAATGIYVLGKYKKEKKKNKELKQQLGQ
ncbi:hypothetical protein OnM2_023051 [Erysiphe neolycopersici]|uniref:Uncharacterized protein n=1 Tax=Erysiphe neolycopersici TaxID=212602 RepID=A0A420I291_9PEZI|nr:hypothetical protein OnM2_023051 [Erysiphe neolycopersici]